MKKNEAQKEAVPDRTMPSSSTLRLHMHASFTCIAFPCPVPAAVLPQRHLGSASVCGALSGFARPVGTCEIMEKGDKHETNKQRRKRHLF